jgi:hypothetical protein
MSKVVAHQSTLPVRHLVKNDCPRLSALLIIAVTAVNMVSSEATVAGEAFGGGVADVPDTTQVEQLSFHVREIGDDTDDLARGEIKLLAKSDGRISFLSRLDADCMRFLDDRTAIIAGTVVNDSDPSFIGTTAIFTVRDNGQGARAPADEFTGIFYALDNPDVDVWTCQAGVDFLDANPGALEDLLTPFAPGNIHVHSSPSVAAVPEPTGLVLSLFGLSIVAGRYRRRFVSSKSCSTTESVSI